MNSFQDESHSEQPINEENMNEDILLDTDEEMKEMFETPRKHGIRDIIRRLQTVSVVCFHRLKKLRSAVQRSIRLKKVINSKKKR